MTWPQVISSAADFVTTGAVVFGAYVAIKGINAWRRETLGKRKIEIAEQAIPIFARARAAIREARSPYMPVGEVLEVYRVFSGEDDTPNPEQLGKLAHQYYAPIHRLQKHRESFVELDGIQPIFMAYFGDDGRSGLTLSRRRTERSASPQSF